MKKPVCYTVIDGMLLLLQSCDYYDTRLILHNNTNRTITVEAYEDTIPDFPSINLTEVYLNDTIVSGATHTPMMPDKNGWEKIIYRSKKKVKHIYL